MHAALPVVVHGVAAAAVIFAAFVHDWVWVLGGVVLCSAIGDFRSVRRELRCTHTLTMHGRRITLDGVAVRIVRGWLGPGLTVMWLRVGRRREMISVYQSELRGADHAALRRQLRAFDFSQ